MTVCFDAQEIKLVCEDRASRVRELAKSMIANPDDSETAQLLLDCSSGLKELETLSTLTMQAGHGQSKEKSQHEYNEVQRILSDMTKKALGKEDLEKLRKYYNRHSLSSEFRFDFAQDFNSARDVYLHRDDDRASLSYSLALISLMAMAVDGLPVVEDVSSLSEILSWVAVIFVILAFVLMAIWLPQLGKSFGYKICKRMERMEEFYREINSHCR